MAVLFNSTKLNISQHINNIYNEGELDSCLTVKEYLTVQKEGERQIKSTVSAYTTAVSEQLKLYIARFNTQYPKIDVQIFHKSNNRFLSIDRLTVCPKGASLKNTDKKWFAFTTVNIYPRQITGKLNHFQYNPVCKGQSATVSIAPLRTPPWSLKYTDGSTSTTYRGITVSPYTITVSPAASKRYTVTALSEIKCTAEAGVISGTAVMNVSTNCQKVILSQSAKLSAHNRNAIFIPGSKFHQTFALFRLSFTHTSDSGPP